MSLIRGIRAGYPSGVIRAEGSERKNSSVGNRAEGSELVCKIPLLARRTRPKG